jgi:uracil-DNA glycosylase
MYRNLTPWADNGVLMLNTCLTVRAAQAGSHSNKGWEDFTDKVVDIVDKYGGANLGAENLGFGRGVVFLAWGTWAAKRVAKLSKVGHILDSVVPKTYTDAPSSKQLADKASHTDECGK